MGIEKIRDERLTEDEKMEIIADYLENGGGGGGGSSDLRSTLLFIQNISSLTQPSGGSFYLDSAKTHAVTRAEMNEIVMDMSDAEAIPPREVWIRDSSSSDCIFKVIAGYYNDLDGGFWMSGPAGDGTSIVFYHVYADSSDPDSTLFHAAKSSVDS